MKYLHSNYWQNLHKQNLNKGFTLTELLLIILITGVIPAAFAPYLLSYYQLHEQQVSLDK